MKKLFSLILILCALLSLPFYVGGQSFAASNFTTVSQFNKKTYTHYGDFASTTVKDMIDVSEHNGLINWDKVKALGIDNAIIRVGFRGYGAAGSIGEDDYYYDNIESAIDAGVNVGIYFYSQALTTAEAVTEANFCLKRVKSYKITLPIFYDYEFAGVSSGRLDKAWANGTLNKTKMTNNALAFCDAIKAAGYDAGVYASASFFTDQLNTSAIYSKGYEIWNAYYIQNSTLGNYWTNKNRVYKYWQYGGANVQGVCGNPDTAWLKVKYSTYTGYVSAKYIDFTGAISGVAISDDGLNLRSGAGTSYSVVTRIPFAGKVTIMSYPTSNDTDVNFYYASDLSKPDFSLSADESSVTVSWEAISTASYYRVYSYDKQTGKYERLAQLKTTSYKITNLSEDTEYTYLVRAFYPSGDGSKYSLSDNQSIRTAPKKPENVTLSSKTDNSLSILWNKVSNASFYRVYSYDKSTKKYTRLAQVNGTSCTLQNLKSGSEYTILVRAFNQYSVGSAYSVSDNKSFSTLPQAPDFSFTRYSYGIKISWKAVNSAAYYRVYSYNKSTGKYTRIAQTTDLFYQQEGLNGNTSYIYLVRAFNAHGEGSLYKTADNKEVKTLLRKPQFNLKAPSDSIINISWAKISGASYYRVYTYNAQTKKYTRIAQTKNLSFNYNCSAGNEYIFLVRAFDAAGDGSSYSAANHKSIFIPIEKAKFDLSSDAAGTVNLTWQKVSGASFYRVYSFDVKTQKYTRIAQTSALKYTLKGLESGGEYTFLVRAFSESSVAADYEISDNKSVSVK